METAPIMLETLKEKHISARANSCRPSMRSYNSTPEIRNSGKSQWKRQCMMDRITLSNRFRTNIQYHNTIVNLGHVSFCHHFASVVVRICKLFIFSSSSLKPLRAFPGKNTWQCRNAIDFFCLGGYFFSGVVVKILFN